ncbi:unnamed protein product [Bursaphelenchus xylophilus]|uniref:(pine wood nematode) hypothetical protein n=1 Tax=Bursaphelenchus xylophilus TaxID=6326 RepID=A0A1I7SEK9_BURXY|nr:unnamed protein product [Bursaphelenchus xylophilus]CAG9113611.1 unnamed protein product [Bursaphelenchus xylophilus]
MLLKLILFLLLDLFYSITTSTCPKYGLDVVINKQCPPFNHPACYYAFEQWGEAKDFHFRCNSVDPFSSPSFGVVDPTKLRQTLTKTDEYGRNRCNMVLFYTPRCIYSQRLIMSYSYLAVLFPKVGFYLLNLDAKEGPTEHIINKYGIAATPTMILFANGSTYARVYDGQKKLKKMIQGILDLTDLKLPDDGVTLHEYDDFEVQLKDLEYYRDHYEGVIEGLHFEDTKTYLDRGFLVALVVMIVNLVYFAHYFGYISLIHL